MHVTLSVKMIFLQVIPLFRNSRSNSPFQIGTFYSVRSRTRARVRTVRNYLAVYEENDAFTMFA